MTKSKKNQVVPDKKELLCYEFNKEQIIKITKSGSKNLEALQALLQPLPHATGQGLSVRRDGKPYTYLSILQEAGFTPEHLVSVLANDGGSKNLAALQALLQVLPDETGQ